MSVVETLLAPTVASFRPRADAPHSTLSVCSSCPISIESRRQNHRQIKLTAVSRRKISQAPHDIRHHHHRRTVPTLDFGPWTLDFQTTIAATFLARDFVQEIVPIMVFTLDGKEHIARAAPCVSRADFFNNGYTRTAADFPRRRIQRQISKTVLPPKYHFSKRCRDDGGDGFRREAVSLSPCQLVATLCSGVIGKCPGRRLQPRDGNVRPARRSVRPRAQGFLRGSASISILVSGDLPVNKLRCRNREKSRLLH